LPDGQAGAAEPAELGNKSEPTALRFGHLDDAHHLSRDFPENGYGLAVGKNINLAKSYQEGECKVVIEFSARPNSAKYDLVFFAVQGHVSGDTAIANGYGFTKHSAGLNGDGNKRCMCCISELVQTPNKIVPSIVRLERPKQHDDFIRDVFAGFMADDSVIKSGKVVSDRELGLFRVRVSSSDRGGKPSLVKSGPKRFKRLSCGVDAAFRKPFSEFEFMELSNAVSVQLNDRAVWCFFEEPFDALVKSGNVLVCSF
jgi:hypothetical protein